MAYHMLKLAPGPEWGSAGPVRPWAEVWVKDACERFAAGLLYPLLPGTISPQVRLSNSKADTPHR